MRKEELFIICLAIALLSCGDNSSDPISEGSDAITISQTSTTSFTASITGSFPGISIVDRALGKSGVLYCKKTDNSNDIFKSWKDGNDTQDCTIYDKGNFNGETMSCTISGLDPDTEYSYCLFSQNQDKTVREISKVYVFKTTSFNPDIQSAVINDIHFIDAVASVSVEMDEKDASYCKMQILVSETENCNVDNSIILPYNDSFSGLVKKDLDNLESNKTYYCRLYIKYTTSSGQSGYVYGPESSFRTKDLMDIAVDMGLPSGIKWASCSMEEYEFASSLMCSPIYYWGSSQKMVTYLEATTGKYKFTEVNDEHIDSYGNYADLGQEISGTDYDVVHLKYGGNWRMPTKADFEELLDNCTMGNKQTLHHKFYVDVYNYQDGAYRKVEIDDVVDYFEVKGPNDNSIRFRLRDASWSGTMEDDSNVYYLECRQDNSVPNITIQSTTRQQRSAIRPVWDPNM